MVIVASLGLDENLRRAKFSQTAMTFMQARKPPSSFGVGIEKSCCFILIVALPF